MMITHDTREHILTEAFKLFLIKGFKSVTMADLEKATGLTKGAFYHHFKDKVDIFRESVKICIQALNLKITDDRLKSISVKDFIQINIKHQVQLSKFFESLDDQCIMESNLGMILADVSTYLPDFVCSLSKVLEKQVFSWERVLFYAKEREEVRADIEVQPIVYLFVSISESVRHSRALGKSIQYGLSLMMLQYEQLYNLIKR